jgi:hypothetical protein
MLLRHSRKEITKNAFVTGQLTTEDWLCNLDALRLLIAPYLENFDVFEIGDLKCLYSGKNREFSHNVKNDNLSVEVDNEGNRANDRSLPDWKGLFFPLPRTPLKCPPGSEMQDKKQCSGEFEVWGITPWWVCARVYFTARCDTTFGCVEYATRIFIWRPDTLDFVEKYGPQIMWKELIGEIDKWVKSRKMDYDKAVSIADIANVVKL